MALIRFLVYSFIFTIPFGLRKEIFSFIEGFQEYETIFFYASDVLLTLFLGFFVLRRDKFFYIKNQISKIKYQISNIKYQINSKLQIQKIILVIFLMLAGVSIFFAYSKGLAIYNSVRLLMAVGFSWVIAWSIKEEAINLQGICWSLGLSAVFQSFVAFLQFIQQKSLGLWFLGESVLGANIPGVAKITVEGGKLIRAYGTMPHSNILAAFLIVGLLALSYVWLRLSTNNEFVTNLRIKRLFSVAGIFIVITGLILTFSRSGWIIATISIIALLVGLIIENVKVKMKNDNEKLKIKKNLFFEHGREKTLLFALIFILSSVALANFLIFKDFILARGHISKSEVSVTQRLVYNEVAWDIIKNRPLGVGIGNQILYSVKNGIYQNFGMNKAWQWEPIHNIYLLIASEIGVVGGVMFVVFLLSLLITNYQLPITKREIKFDNRGLVISRLMFIAFLAFGLVDHFLWTLWPGKLMLWLIIGMLMGVSSLNGAHSSMDRAQASEA